MRRGGTTTGHHACRESSTDKKFQQRPAPRLRATGAQLIKARAKRRAATPPRASHPIAPLRATTTERPEMRPRRPKPRRIAPPPIIPPHPRVTDEDRDGWAGGHAMVLLHAKPFPSPIPLPSSKKQKTSARTQNGLPVRRTKQDLPFRDVAEYIRPVPQVHRLGTLRAVQYVAGLLWRLCAPFMGRWVYFGNPPIGVMPLYLQAVRPPYEIE